MYLEFYLILLINIANCLGQQYVFQADPALADVMCSADNVQFITTSVSAISCIKVCSLTQNCQAVIFYRGNTTCFGLNTDNPLNESISLPGAVFYKPTTIMSQRSTTTASGFPTSSVSPVLFPPGVNSYGEQYPNNADETTTFIAPEGKRVLLTFGGVEIECEGNANCWPLDDGYSCPHDYLDILENGVSTSRICGSSPEYVYQSTASSVTVRFHTDYGANYRGYQLKVAYVPAV